MTIDWIHLHMIINHIPTSGIGYAIALLAMGIFWRKPALLTVSLALLVFGALITIPVYLTGLQAEEVAEHALRLPNLEHYVEHHEESGLMTLVAAEVVGFLALIGLWAVRVGKALPRWFFPVLLVLTIASAGVFSRTANLGGQIRHTEIRQDALSRLFMGPHMEQEQPAESAADEHD